MKEVLELIKQLQADSSRTGKETIVKNNKDNEDFVEVLRYCADPFTLTGVTKKVLKQFSGKKFGIRLPIFTDFRKVMRYAAVHNSSKHTDIMAIVQFIDQEEDDELREFYFNVISKELKTGAGATILNKVLGKGFVSKFEVLLARNYYDEIDKINDEMFVTLKLDGGRLIAIKDSGVVKFFTRKGQPIDGLTELEDEFNLLPDNFVYDGEVLLANNDHLHSKDLYRETMKVMRKKEEKKNLEYHMFDHLPLSEFREGISKLNYKQRRDNLESLFDEFCGLKLIKKVELLYNGYSKKDVDKVFSKLVDQGFEGVMVNLKEGKYEFKRSKNLLKVKKFQDCDCEIVSFEEGIGRNKGTLGRMNVKYKGGSIVGVGTGFSDYMRSEIYNNQEKYLGKIAKIKYFEESKNSKDGNVSLRFPVYVEIRWDKDEPSFH